MKKILIVMLLFVGCHSNKSAKPREKEGVNIDSIIDISKRNFDKATQVSKFGDSSITKKVDKTVQKIGQLETQVTELKKENNELKAKIDDFNDDGAPYGGLPISPH